MEQRKVQCFIQKLGDPAPIYNKRAPAMIASDRLYMYL